MLCYNILSSCDSLILYVYELYQWYSEWINTHMYSTCIYISVILWLSLNNKHTHVVMYLYMYKMFHLDWASWATLVAQLVKASVRSAECRGFKSHLRQLIFICLLFFLSFFLFISSHHVCIHLSVHIGKQITRVGKCLARGSLT